MTVTSTMGCGAQRGGNGMYRGVPVSMALRPTVQVSVVVSGIPPERVIETAKQALHTGKLGDGKIFVTSVKGGGEGPHRRDGYDASKRGGLIPPLPRCGSQWPGQDRRAAKGAGGRISAAPLACGWAAPQA